jgi:hypothetical protein
VPNHVRKRVRIFLRRGRRSSFIRAHREPDGRIFRRKRRCRPPAAPGRKIFSCDGFRSGNRGWFLWRRGGFARVRQTTKTYRCAAKSNRSWDAGVRVRSLIVSNHLARPKSLTKVRRDRRAGCFPASSLDEDCLCMRILHRPLHLSYECHALPRLVAQRGACFLQAAARREFRAKEREAVFVVAHFMDRQDVGMIDVCGRSRFAAEARERFAGIRLIIQQAFTATIWWEWRWRARKITPIPTPPQSPRGSRSSRDASWCLNFRFRRGARLDSRSRSLHLRSARPGANTRGKVRCSHATGCDRAGTRSVVAWSSRANQ